MLAEVLDHIHNWFVVPHGYHGGTYTVVDGGLELAFLLPSQYFRVAGSVLNDGIYQYPAVGMVDETFTGYVWALAIPKELVALVAEIEAWQTKQGNSPYTAESFGGYTYSKAIGASGAPMTWQDAFRTRLNRWRKL